MEKFKSNISTKEIADLRYLISKGRTVDWGSYSYNDAGISTYEKPAILDDSWKNKKAKPTTWKEIEDEKASRQHGSANC